MHLSRRQEIQRVSRKPESGVGVWRYQVGKDGDPGRELDIYYTYQHTAALTVTRGMEHLAKFVKATLVGGLLVLFPVLGCVYIIVFIGGLLTSTIKPFLSFLPDNRFASLPYADIVSIFIVILLCFITGLFVKTSPGKAFTSWLSRSFDKLPLYRMLRRIGLIFFDQEDPRGAPVLVEIDNTKQFGFMIEQNGAEECTVFFPGSPSPISGNIKIVKAGMVEKLNVHASEVARVLGAFGAGTGALFANGRDQEERSTLIDPPERT